MTKPFLTHDQWVAQMRQRLEHEIQEQNDRYRRASQRQRAIPRLRQAQIRLGPFPPDSVAVRFPSRGAFEEFMTATGAGSWTIEGPKPVSFLAIEDGCADTAIRKYGATLAFPRS